MVRLDVRHSSSGGGGSYPHRYIVRAPSIYPRHPVATLTESRWFGQEHVRAVVRVGEPQERVFVGLGAQERALAWIRLSLMAQHPEGGTK